MTDKKEPDNIIIGPWDAHGKVNDEQASDWVKRKYQKALDKNNTQLKMQEKISKIDIITEGVMVQLIHTLSENGYDIGEDSFILDIGFLSETVKSALYRQEKLPHVIQGLIDNIMMPDKTQNEDGIEMHYSRFDSRLLGDLVDMADEVREIHESDGQLDVEFEPDTEIGEVTNWRKTQLDKEKEKETLHTKRIKDLESKKNKKDDDEE